MLLFQLLIYDLVVMIEPYHTENVSIRAESLTVPVLRLQGRHGLQSELRAHHRGGDRRGAGCAGRGPHASGRPHGGEHHQEGTWAGQCGGLPDPAVRSVLDGCLSQGPW